MDFAAAKEFLDAHINYETGVTNDRSGVQPWTQTVGDPSIHAPRRLDPPTLDRMRKLLAYLGDPQLDLSILHVTGTNGKGSVARMAASLLRANGASVGLYTSPHLEQFNERLRVNEHEITNEQIAQVVRVLQLAEQASGDLCSYFELLTALAFRWFGDEAVEAAVIEVGAGGRWDATNTGDGLVGVITNIGLDHLEWFGPTKLDIAREKVGIVKPGSIAVIGETDPELQVFLEKEAKRLEAAATWTAGVDFACDANRLALGGRLLTLRTPTTSYRDVMLPLHGSFQGDNAAIALAAVEAFLDKPLEDDVVRTGFAEVSNPGRLEVLDRDPLVVIDGAHNPDGARVAAQAINEAFAATQQRVVVVGLLNGRDPVEMLRAIASIQPELVIAVAPDSPRAMSPQRVVEAAVEVGVSAVSESSVERALLRAETMCSDEGMILVTGSLYLVGTARRLMRRKNNR